MKMPVNRHKCFVPSCSNSVTVNPDVAAFRFPSSQSMLLKWIAAIGCDHDASDAGTLQTKYVCSEHFEMAAFTTQQCTKLNRGAVPSRFHFSSTADISSVTLRDEPPPKQIRIFTEVSPIRGDVLDMISESPSPHVNTVSRVYCNKSIGASTSSTSTLVSFPSNLKNSGLCHSHIQPSMSTPISGIRAKTRLPFSYLNKEVAPVEDNASTSNDASDILAVPLNISLKTPKSAVAVRVPKSNTGERKRSALLQKLDAVKISDLTPRKKVLFNELRTKGKALSRLRKECKKKKLILQDHVNLLENPVIENLTQKMSSAAGRLLLSQLRCAGRKPRGRRWDVNDKVMALTIYKRSPAAYALFRCMFALPCKRTLIQMLNSVPFVCGIDARVVNMLKMLVKKMPDRDKYCALLFDEMSLREHVDYSPQQDRIIGFEDDGVNRTSFAANHVLVLIIRGLHKKWKQPIACFFSRGGMKKNALKSAIEIVLAACSEIGVFIVATICDMGANNVAALKLMGAKFPDPIIEACEHRFAVVFDPPHLLKCTRNMFLTNSVRGIKVTGQTGISGAARWQHIVKMYNEEKLNALFSLVPKLTDTHVAPSSVEKMRVSTAAQVMSHSVAAAIHSYVSRGILPPEANITATFVSDVDKLFDSFNGSEPYPEAGKPLKCRISNQSPHVRFWCEEAKSKVFHWTFFKDKTEKIPPKAPGKSLVEVTRPPSQWGWITSINAAVDIWRVLSEAEFQYFQIKSLNQDPLENFFGAIRSYCGSNSNPTCSQFIGALKTGIINGLTYKGYFDGNCQADDASLLSDLKGFLFGGVECKNAKDSSNQDTSVTPEMCGNTTEQGLNNLEEYVNVGDVGVYSVAYVSGFVARRILKNLSCSVCTNALTSSDEEMFNTGISFKEYSEEKCSLTYPSEKLVLLVGKCASVFAEAVANISHSECLSEKLHNHILKEVSFLYLGLCVEHFEMVVAQVIKGVCVISLKWWCKRKNREFVAQHKKKGLSSRKINILKHV